VFESELRRKGKGRDSGRGREALLPLVQLVETVKDCIARYGRGFLNRTSHSGVQSQTRTFYCLPNSLSPTQDTKQPHELTSPSGPAI
jgi:hypothetical protein